MSDRAEAKAKYRRSPTGRDTVERITRREANARLDLGDLGLEQHYLGPSGYRGDIALSNARRDAIAILRPPIAASFNRALGKPLEISRLLRTVDREPPLSAFVAGCMRWIKSAAPECSCVIAYTDVDTVNSETGAAHSGGIYRAANFVHVGEAPAGEAHWLAEDGKRINRQKAYRMLGTKAKAAVALARPGWRYVAGSPKRLFIFPVALTVPDVLARLEALPRSARTRPFRLTASGP